MKMFKLRAILILLLSTNLSHAGNEGGGGNTIPPMEKPISIKELSPKIGNSRARLLQYLNYLDSGFWPTASYYKNLVSGDNAFLQAVRKVRIIENADGPCYDNEGNPTDGSSHSEKGPGICISTFNLSKKLNRENADIQLLALIAHEYAHLAGADEAQAKSVQLDVYDELYGQWNTSTWINLDRAQFAIKDILLSVERTNFDNLCRQAEQLYLSYEYIHKSTRSGQFSVLNLEGQKIMGTTRLQILNLVTGTCLYAKALSGHNSKWSNAEFETKYEYAFLVQEQSQEQVQAIRFSKFYSDTLGPYGHIDFFNEYPILKITDKIVFKKVMLDIDHNLKQLSTFGNWIMRANMNK